MNNNQDIILRIRELMEELALNQTTFSKESHIEQANLSAILNGKRPIGSAVINKIVLAFDINKNWLITGEGEHFRPNMMRDTQAAYGQKATNEKNIYETVKILSRSNVELLEMYKQSVQKIRTLEDLLSASPDKSAIKNE
jgi:transcriptional regulator with XRE-family HTH domain